MNARAPILAAAALALGVGGALLWTKGRPTETEDVRHAEASASPENAQPPIKSSEGPARPAPPRLKPGAPTNQLPTDPRSPDYDAVKLFHLADVPVADIFAKEPRDPVWAPQMETWIKANHQQDFERVGLTTKVESVECHSATCAVTLKAADELELRKSNTLFQAISNASLVASAGPLPGADAAARYHVAYDSAMRNPEANQKVYPQRRRHMLSQIRQAAATAPKEALRDFPPLPED